MVTTNPTEKQQAASDGLCKTCGCWYAREQEAFAVNLDCECKCHATTTQPAEPVADHSPLPQLSATKQPERFNWDYQEINGKHAIFEGNLLVAVVGECFSHQTQLEVPDITRQIVNDHNLHEELVAALRQLDDVANDCVDDVEEAGYPVRADRLVKACTNARAVLAKVEAR